MAERTTDRCVFKLGGSLLDQVDWPMRLRAWLNQQPPGKYFGIVGGGDVVEAMRKLDRVHGLSQTAMHWRCIRLLDATLEIASELTPEIKVLKYSNELLIHSAFEIRENLIVSQRELYWVHVSAFYQPGISDLGSLPADTFWPTEGWATTTDTLALMLAHQIHAHRVVLMKSCEVGHIDSLEMAAKVGIVDRECLRLREHVPQVELLRL